MIYTNRLLSIEGRLVAFLLIIIITGIASSSYAQKASDGKRAPRVEVAEVMTRVLTNFADVQGRVVAGPRDSITATTNAIIRIGNRRLGDLVADGDIIAVQDSAKLRLQLKRLQANLREAEVEFADGAAELRAEAELLSVISAQAELLAGKAKRAEGLVANSALAADAAETALNASMAASVALLVRQSSLARKKAQQEITSVTITQTKVEIAQLMADIKATKLRAETKGQITHIVDYRRGFAREGDVIAKITDLNDFEIEAEIPISYVNFLENTKAVSGRDLHGKQIDVKFRVLLPVENLRSATRTARFSFTGQPPSILRAENALVVIQVPTTSPKPMVIVPKDAVLPITGGHLVYLVEGDRVKRQKVQLGPAVKEGFIVKKGVFSGQKVVTRGNEQLSDGRTVQIGKLGFTKTSRQKKTKGDQ